MSEKKLETYDTVGLTPEESGRKRLKRRVERLTRLVELDAPKIVLSNEAHLVIDALWLMCPDEMATIVKDREAKRLRQQAGFCIDLECTKAAVLPQAGGFGYCPEHHEQAEELSDEIDDMSEE